MKKMFISMLLISAVIGNCKKKTDGSTGSSSDVRYARYGAAINKEPGKTWVASINKAEDVTVLKKETVGNKEYSFVKTAGGKEGYIDSSYLAGRPFVVTDSSGIMVNANPTVTSRKVMKMPRATVGFVLEEKTGWLKIYAGNISEAYDYSKNEAGKYNNVTWINEYWIESAGISYDLNLVAQAVELESLMVSFGDPDREKSSKANEQLTKIREDVSHPFSKVACLALSGNIPDYCTPAPEPDSAHP